MRFSNPMRRVAVAAVATGALLAGGAAYAAVQDSSATVIDSPAVASLPAERVTTTTAGPGPIVTAPTLPTRGSGTLLFPMDPEPYCHVIDSFGDPRGTGRFHAGVDIMAGSNGLGRNVYAVESGVLSRQWIEGQANTQLSGNGWNLRSATGTTYAFLHLSGFAPGLSVGSTVIKGQVIGYVGDTGNPGPGNYHLHFEVRPGSGLAVDPYPLLDIPTACTG